MTVFRQNQNRTYAKPTAAQADTFQWRLDLQRALRLYRRQRRLGSP